MGVLFSSNAKAQCVTSPNFNNWVDEGDSAAAWTVISSGTQCQQNSNTWYPNFFVGPDTLINVHISGKFRVNTYSDDDYLGFVFGYKTPVEFGWMGWPTFNPSLYNTADLEFYLFDWKKNGQTYSGNTAQEGFSLDKVDGNFYASIATVFPSFWGHSTSTAFNVLQTQYSTSNGWVSFTTYDFDLYYAPTRALILIDSDTIFDQSGCFEPGRFGFYGFSQSGATYWDFQYELFIDFGMEAQNVCLGDTMNFTFIDTGTCYSSNTFSTVDTFYWDLGDGTLTNDTNPNHYYDTAGAYTVNLIATDVNGCTDTATKIIYIHNAPNAEIGFGDVCNGDSMVFADSTSLPYGYINGWSWSFGDGNTDTNSSAPVHTYNQNGFYTVQLAVEDNAGCVDTTDTIVQVYANPVPQFQSQNACDGNAVQLIDQSIPALSPIINNEWDVDDNGSVDYNDSSTVNNVYATHGTYAVQLTVYDSLGCRDSVTDLITVFPMPTADFEVPSVCFTEASVFQDSSEVATGQITNWAWDFGDGSASSVAEPSHIFPTSGLQHVQLLITSNGGCQDSVTKTIGVYHLPVAVFETEAQCRNLPVNFIQNSTSQSGNIASYSWDFGDGDTSLSSGPIHDYLSAGLFPVNLKVVTQYGCEDTAQSNIRIYPAPDAAFNWTNNVCEGDPLPFFDQSSISSVTPGGDQIVSWNWLVNGSQLNIQNPVYTTSYFEKLNVFLLVTSNNGCVDSVRNYPEIFPIPEPAFTEYMGCAERVSSFIDESSIAVGLVDQWMWDFGDGNSADSINPNHIYALSGDYDVRLTITSNKGCVNETEHTVHVHETPVIDFKIVPDEGCSPHSPRAVNLSTIAIGTLSYEWRVNGKYLSDEQAPSFFLVNDTLEPVSFDIAMTATSDKGCQASKKKNEAVWVLPSPKAKFQFVEKDVDLFEPVIHFNNQSEHSIRWHWNFNDGASSVDFAPAHEYTNSGLYRVRLISWNTFGCSDTVINSIDIEPITTLYIPSAFTPNGDGDNDVFNLQGFNEGNRFEIRIWDRWGHLIMQSDDMNFSWDGRLSDNKLAPVGVYAYDILYQESNEEYREIHGQFSLLR